MFKQKIKTKRSIGCRIYLSICFLLTGVCSIEGAYALPHSDGYANPAPNQQSNITVSGVVKDLNGIPLIGVTRQCRTSVYVYRIHDCESERCRQT